MWTPAPLPLHVEACARSCAFEGSPTRVRLQRAMLAPLQPARSPSLPSDSELQSPSSVEVRCISHAHILLYVWPYFGKIR
eukprot:1401744-Pleurochrysis_carterae.AAC.1